MAGKVIGIDLGTANSCVAVLDDEGTPIVLADEDGKTTQPSIFAMNSAQEPIVGRKAEAQADTNRLNTIFAVKRLIGRKYDSEEVREAASKLPYKIIAAENGDAWIRVNDLPMSPEEISARVLEHMKKIAEAHLGEAVDKAVITVPAHFNDAERQATKDAGEIAGLKVLNMINEPTAAALAYGIDIMASGDNDDQQERIIVVFDLGGGTFDVTVLALCGGRFEVKSTNGDTYLGGEDFDLAIVNYIVAAFKKDHGADLTQDKAAMQRVKEAARHVKHALSDGYETEFEIPHVSAGSGSAMPLDIKMKITRKQLEKIVAHLLNSIDGPCVEALDDAGITADDVDDCILVGGMTRMPLIKKHCERVFGKPPIDTINPDTAVACGAAAQAGMMQGLLKGLSLTDVTSLGFYVETAGGIATEILEKNAKIPSTNKRVFTTSSPNQGEITFHILQGDSDYAHENKSVGVIKLSDVPKAARGNPRIELTFNVDDDGIINIATEDLDTGSRKKIEILPSSGLSNDDFEKLVAENRTHKKESERREKKELSREQEMRKKLREGAADAEESEALLDARGKLKAMIFATQFKLDMEGIDYRGDKREALENAIEHARAILDSADSVIELLGARAELEAAEDIFDKFLDAA